MSTRCQIGFYDVDCKNSNDLKNFDALIYRHSDGYPEEVLPDIIPPLKEFNKRRGVNDTEYASARLLQHLCNNYDKRMIKFKGFHKTLGLGISKSFHGDIEYLYAVSPNVVKVYDVCGWGKSQEFELIKEISIK